MLSSSTSSPVTPQATVPKDATAVSANGAALETKAAVSQAGAETRPRYEGTWQELIEGDQLAALEVNTVSDEDASHVAKLCLEHADAHPEAVKRALFMNGNVRTEALKLLQVNVQCGPELQNALALCFLDAGYELQGKSLAPEVAELLAKRWEMEDEYLEWKQAKHGTAEGMPFFYKDKKYSRDNHNGNLSSSNPAELFWCRHMETAAAGNTKIYLQDISKPIPDVSKLNYKLLDEAERASRGVPTVNFSPGNMGKLLMRLALDVKVGERRSFRVGWLGAGTGHGMRIFLEKTDKGFFKVGLYEPNVSGNISHKSVLPEKLAALNFDDFDTLKVRPGSQRAVLALEVESAELAKSCAGAFVSKTHYLSQIDSLGQALAHGKLWEMEISLKLLEKMEWPSHDSALQNFSAERLADTMFVALADGRGPAVKQFMAGLQHLHFTPAQIAVIVTATAKHLNDEEAVKRPIPTGLHTALQAGHADAVEVFIAGLKALPLTAAQIADIVLAKDSNQRPGLYKALQHGRPGAVGEFMAGLRDLGLTGQQIADIVAAKDSSSTSGLHRALAEGHHAAIEKFLPNLASLGLTPAQCADIAMAKDDRGNPGLAIALEKGHGTAVQKFLETLPTLNLSPAQIVDIVTATNSIAVPGLFLALQRGHGPVVKAFMAGLKSLNGLGLTPAQFAEMVAAKDPRRNSMVPALHLALKVGNAVEVAEFMAGLQALGGLLTPTEIVEIVLARDADQTPGLYAALVAGRGAAVEAFMNGLQGLGGPGGLTRADFANILSARPSEDKPPALQEARDRGHADTVEKYYQVLSQSGLVRPARPDRPGP